MDIKELVAQWLTVDEDPETRQEIINLSDNVAELEKRLRNRIVFGTAGLRAKMEAGFSRMNNVTVMQASQGLADYVLKQEKINKSVIIGHDHRFHSKKFAEITITAFLLKGFKVYYLSSSELGDLIPTPLVPFGVDYFNCDVGVMITASHNPKDDNGYKVYWSNGCQIIPPHDSNIADSILNNLAPIKDSYNTEKVMTGNPNLKFVKEESLTAYLLHLNSKLIKFKNLNDLKFVYTPMHGVGLEVFQQAVKFLGVEDLHGLIVEKQSVPDPNFPTVKFPNPEEKGALTLAQEFADSKGIELVIANDPDADRFTASIKVDKWYQLSGNELGYLFAEYVYTNYKDSLDDLYFINSTVSSQMIKSMAEVLGFNYTDTLTGFKWIGNKAIELEKEGYKVPFGYEEAIGFMFEGIHDKDGISASIVFLQLYKYWKDKGLNLLEVLENGYKKFGYFKEYNSYYFANDSKLIDNVFATIRAEENPYPKKFFDYDVVYWRDLTTGYQSDTKDNKPNLPIDPNSHMITFNLRKNSDIIRLTIRNSGTEPKLKIYIEAKSNSELSSESLTKDIWNKLKLKWFKPEETGLIEA